MLIATRSSARLGEITWMGQPASREILRLGDVTPLLPKFERRPCGENEYLDIIIRRPIGEDERSIPVGTVSKRYALIQHAEVVEWLKDGLQAVHVDLDNLSTELTMSHYGERVRFRVTVPSITIDPGDSHAIAMMLECQNSVDRSCALELRVSWQRLVCMNGLAVPADDRLRKVHHLDWMNRTSVAEFVKERIDGAKGIADVLDQWMHLRLTMTQIYEWADETLAKAWSKTAAARVCHIAHSGHDGIVARQGGQPHTWIVSSDIEVPGACAPIRNVYHLSQALSWVCQHRKAVEKENQRLDQIPQLLKPLIDACR